MAESLVAVVSRQWHQPQIDVGVSESGIRIVMPMDDYIQALATEIGSPAMILTQAQLLTRMRAAATAVQMGMQKVTAEAMAAHIPPQ
jgi:hypothetical protein